MFDLSFISFINSSETVFQCLDVLMKLNHSLLEPHLETIWTMIWKAGHTNAVAHNSLMSSLVSTYVKLRQVYVFVVLLEKTMERHVVVLILLKTYID